MSDKEVLLQSAKRWHKHTLFCFAIFVIACAFILYVIGSVALFAKQESLHGPMLWLTTVAVLLLVCTGGWAHFASWRRDRYFIEARRLAEQQ